MELFALELAALSTVELITAAAGNESVADPLY